MYLENENFSLKNKKKKKISYPNERKQKFSFKTKGKNFQIRYVPGLENFILCKITFFLLLDLILCF